jgi:hypothetical protein
MNRLKLLLAILILPVCAFAQGTFLFQWHGQSNFFQASFELTASEMQPGAVFNSPLFYSSIEVTSLDGIVYHGTPPDNFATGDYMSGFELAFHLNDFAHGMELSAGASGSGMTGVMHEKPFSGGDLYFETGYWTYSEIPEPSVAALSGIGVLLVRKIKV